MRILLIEDDPILALLAEIALEEDGHEIIGPAYDVAGALLLAQTHGIDIAFVDINLDGHDEGVGLAQTLYEQFNIHSLFVSGQIDVAKANSGYALGLLSKPYSPNDLSRSAHIVHALVQGELPLNRPLPVPLKLFTESRGLYGKKHE
ncbi:MULTISPECIES: response regulator [Pseudomonas]|jgi:DNA-binding NarL/FixJ family response regulator|uniref:Response regulator n=1 Tax=Pseudomonas coleopterorum TaxID=1605838 RepID=A0AAJ6M3B0_9PSED|nr:MULTISPECIES: response regulator [Pseudomonas]KQQ62822.1 hypothetical protein ASF66_00255 [Pseudomonas sp. Leaf129]KTC33060.1 hypothetical protein AO269_21285 [Pseudomonas putida]WNC11535.1 response regulator [Pseudomonas coleopterorum]SEE42787.1 Response regulator receiver domain-containing protein [Pseudomonas coleopterorum]